MPWWGRSVENDKRMLGLVVQEWIELANLVPEFRWGLGHPAEFRLKCRGAFAIVARDLAFAFGRSPGFALCSGCGKPFEPSRKPRDGQRPWCLRCRNQGRPQAAASRDYRIRVRDAGG